MRRIVKEVDNKRIFRLHRRYEEIKRELVKRYPVHFSLFPRWYSFNGPIDDIENFLKLRDEALRIIHIIHNKEYRKYVKYVKGGKTFFYTPMKKKEKRKAQRKFRLLPIGYFQQVYEEETPYQKTGEVIIENRE